MVEVCECLLTVAVGLCADAKSVVQERTVEPIVHSRHLTGMAEHKHSPEEEQKIREAALDETLKETFPASDPPSTDPNPDNDELLEDQ